MNHCDKCGLNFDGDSEEHAENYCPARSQESEISVEEPEIEGEKEL